MRSMVRYLVILSAIVGIAWLLVAVPIGDRPLFGHLTHGRPAAWWASTKRFFVELWPGEPAPKAAPKKWEKKRKVADVPPKPPAIQSDKGAARRVALLGEAAQSSSRAPVATKKARVDERISKGDKKGLDALVANREAARR
jgi:hypothetical protein